PSSDGAETAGLVERPFGLQREDAAIGALEELAPLRLGQLWPVSGVGEEPVLVVALATRVQCAASGQDVDRRAAVAARHQVDAHARGGLATADDADVLRALVLEPALLEPVGPRVQDTGVITRLARHRDHGPGAGDDHPVGSDRLSRGERELPAITVGNLQA